MIKKLKNIILKITANCSSCEISRSHIYYDFKIFCNDCKFWITFTKNTINENYFHFISKTFTQFAIDIFFFSKFQSTTFIHFTRQFSRKMLRKFDDFMQKFQWFVNLNHEFKHENLTFEKYILQLWILFVETFKNWIDNDKKIQTLINKKKMSLKMTKKNSRKLFAISILSRKSSFSLTTNASIEFWIQFNKQMRFFENITSDSTKSLSKTTIRITSWTARWQKMNACFWFFSSNNSSTIYEIWNYDNQCMLNISKTWSQKWKTWQKFAF